jgi:hypothetical protein
MSHVLNLEVSDQVFQAIRVHGEATGRTPAQVVAAALERQFPPGNGAGRTEEERQAARLRFENQIGAIDLGVETGAENDAIDSDLAREYSDCHETR